MKFKVVNSKNTILQEEAIHIILEKDGKEFEASGLFFKWNEINDEEITELIHEEELSDEANAFEIVDKIIELEKDYGLKVFESSRSTLLHWQWVNGVTNTFVGSNGQLVSVENSD